MALPQLKNIRNNGWRLWQIIRQDLSTRHFLQASGLLMLANIIVTGLGLVRTPLITWIIPKDEVGMFGVLASWMPFIQLASLSGFDAASYHYTAKGQAWAFLTTLDYRLRWSLLSSAGLLAGAGYWVWRGDTGLAVLFLIAGISYPLTLGLSAAAGVLGAQENFKGLFWYRILESLTDFTGFVPLLLSVWLVNMITTFYGFNQLATALMMIGYSAWLVTKIRRSNVSPPEPGEEQELASYGKHQTVINGIGEAQTRSDAFLVGVLLPLTTMADYSLALIVQELFKRLWIVYSSVRYPVLVKLPLRKRYHIMLAEGVPVWVGFMVAAVPMSLLARWAITVFLPSNYLSSRPYIIWLLVSFAVAVPGFWAEMFFRTEQDQRRQYQLRIFGAVTGIIILLIFIQLWGIQGILWGKLLTSCLFSFAGVVMTLFYPRGDVPPR